MPMSGGGGQKNNLISMGKSNFSGRCVTTEKLTEIKKKTPHVKNSINKILNTMIKKTQ